MSDLQHGEGVGRAHYGEAGYDEEQAEHGGLDRRSGDQEIRRSGDQEIWRFGDQYIRRSGDRDIGISGYREIRRSGDQEIKRLRDKIRSEGPRNQDQV